MAKIGIDKVKSSFKNFALFTNASGVDSMFRRNIEILDPLFVIVGEHGMYLEVDRGKDFESYYEYFSGKKIYPIYPTFKEDLLDGVDGVLVDIQDVGVRCFTYVHNIKSIIEMAAKKHLKVVVFDRFNPVGKAFGSSCHTDSIVCPKDIPFLYGVSVGSLAKFFGRKFGAEIEVFETEGNPTYEEMEKFLSNVSQNLNSFQSVLLYPSLVLLEGFKYVSVGRGTNKPFRMVLLEDKRIAKEFVEFLKSLDLKGVLFHETIQKPCFDTLRGEILYGVEFFVYDKDNFDQMFFGFNLVKFFFDNGFEFSKDDSGNLYLDLIYPNLIENLELGNIYKFYEEERIKGSVFLNEIYK
ncbi:exo-beta-N-acetylmuramidase NamZ domain-containing protein [Caldisericum exile]|uniref:DUF1343 domain-containing protein n=1 Tax=Caldisericum exile (strain DSM 21853 / NBRC 104410 / AZM16c01) TaxID=511051 RepID=A0A7U6JGL5_CALEA|nr:exo-beta-N-acetylmuramidase NamZ domain-containing protein [Caldisericum exile]BAL80422.1 hypothetical protein CSE_02960 [Caldisericum exile AZM16c01]